MYQLVYRKVPLLKPFTIKTALLLRPPFSFPNISRISRYKTKCVRL